MHLSPYPVFSSSTLLAIEKKRKRPLPGATVGTKTADMPFVVGKVGFRPSPLKKPIFSSYLLPISFRVPGYLQELPHALQHPKGYCCHQHTHCHRSFHPEQKEITSETSSEAVLQSGLGLLRLLRFNSRCAPRFHCLYAARISHSHMHVHHMPTYKYITRPTCTYTHVHMHTLLHTVPNTIRNSQARKVIEKNSINTHAHSCAIPSTHVHPTQFTLLLKMLTWRLLPRPSWYRVNRAILTSSTCLEILRKNTMHWAGSTSCALYLSIFLLL